MKTLFIVLISILFVNCSNYFQNKDIGQKTIVKHDTIIDKTSKSLKFKKDSLDFYKLYDMFFEVKLPLYSDSISDVLSWFTKDYTLKQNLEFSKGISEKDDLMRFICEYKNNYKRYIIDEQISYNPFFKIESNKKYFCLIYSIYDDYDHHSRIILATFSAKTYMPISKIILASNNVLYYKLSSVIYKEFVINTKAVYDEVERTDNGVAGFLPNKKYPGYFYTVEYNSKYKIDDYGEINLIEEKREQYISLNKNGDIIRNVELPKK